MKIDRKLLDILNRSDKINSVLYFKSPQTAVLFTNEDQPFSTLSIDTETFSLVTNARQMKNTIIDKLREFGFLQDYHATAMSIGPVGLISFTDGPTIRFDVRPIEYDQLTLPINVNTTSELNHIENEVIKGIILYLIDTFKDDCRFTLFWTIDALDNPEVINLYIKVGKVSTTYAEFVSCQYYKISFSQTARR